jgi:3-methylcrotonyl-CoA carboxylase alpha subunit
MAAQPPVTRIAAGVYRVEHEERGEIVYVAGSARDRWAFWNGHVFRDRDAPSQDTGAVRPRARILHPLTAPMPATVIKVLVAPGSVVKKGDTVIVLEAMKMELPIRAPGDATVTSVHCREGELVQPDTVLIELK